MSDKPTLEALQQEAVAFRAGWEGVMLATTAPDGTPDASYAPCVLDDEAVVTDLIQVADALDADGWEVVVLLPSSRLGEAHAGLRGTPCTLQSWWWHGDRICFGGSEIP